MNNEFIKAYIDDETKRKFEIIRVLRQKKSVSKYAGELIKECVDNYEAEHGTIILPDNKTLGEGGA